MRLSARVSICYYPPWRILWLRAPGGLRAYICCAEHDDESWFWRVLGLEINVLRSRR